jgi:hypothetical protein
MFGQVARFTDLNEVADRNQGEMPMNKPIWLLPLLLPLAVPPRPQDAGACPYLPPIPD